MKNNEITVFNNPAFGSVRAKFNLGRQGVVDIVNSFVIIRSNDGRERKAEATRAGASDSKELGCSQGRKTCCGSGVSKCRHSQAGDSGRSRFASKFYLSNFRIGLKTTCTFLYASAKIFIAYICRQIGFNKNTLRSNNQTRPQGNRNNSSTLIIAECSTNYTNLEVAA